MPPEPLVARLGIGKEQGPHDTNTVKDRIYKWQTRVAEDAQSSQLPNPRSEHGFFPQTTPTSRKTKSTIVKSESPNPVPAPPTSARLAQTVSSARTQIDPNVHAAITPKKRVVSDEHWMKDRSASKPATKPAAKFGKAGPFTTVEWPTADGPVNGKRCDAWVRVKPPPKEKDKETETKDKKSPATTPKKKTPTRNHTTPARVLAKDGDSIAANDAPPSERRFSTQSTPIVTPKKTPSDKPSPQTARSAGDAGKNSTPQSTVKVKKRVPSKADAPPAKPPSNPIDAWLGAMPDPFTEDPKKLAKNIKAPPSIFGVKSSVDEDVGDLQSETPQESEYDRAERRRRRKTRQKSAEVRTPPSASRTEPPPSVKQSESDSRTEHHSSNHSTPTLRRRGARKQRSRSRGETPEQESQVEELIPELTVAPLKIRHSQDAAITTHDDLISVLSVPLQKPDRARSARSVTSRKTDHANLTLDELMKELRDDETKYLRELRTLVDGVIPVLLKTAVSNSHAQLIPGGNKNSAHTTTSIVNMGVALERLKNSHKRIPTSSHVALLIWAQNTQSIYADYLKVWKLGFEEMMINLAPAEEHPSTTRFHSGATQAQQMHPSENEKADVSFLLKRPLVRLKYLAKTFKRMQSLCASEHAAKLALSYQDLVSEAKIRQQDEYARLEDEAAYNTDASRARDPHTLAPLAGIKIDSTRCVKARDTFDLKLSHTNGQRLDCRTELIIRDERPGHSGGGDLLICEVNETSRWLLFPPLIKSRISARQEPKGLFVLMIRGHDNQGKEWYELLSLTAEDEEAAMDWTEMIGTSPIPPHERQTAPAAPLPPPLRPSSNKGQSLLSSYLQDNSGVPLGEPSALSGSLPSKPPSLSFTRSSMSSLGSQADETIHGSPERPKFQLPETQRYYSEPTKPQPKTPSRYHHQSRDSYEDEYSQPQARSEPRRKKQSEFVDPPVALRPPKSEERKSKSFAPTELSITSTPNDYEAVRRMAKKRYEPDPPSPSSSDGFSVWMPSSEIGYDEEEDEDDYGTPRKSTGRRSGRSRQDEKQDSPASSKIMSKMFGGGRRSTGAESAQESSQTSSRPGQSHAASTTTSKEARRRRSKERSAPPKLEPSQTSTNVKRRPSSPLKHEYTPSMRSTEDIRADRDGYFDDDDDESINSEDDAVPSLAPSFTYKAPKYASQGTGHSAAKVDSVAPSDSASQTPHEVLPKPANGPIRVIASIFCWSEKGLWESLHPDECSITVSAGLIEAFDLVALSSHGGSKDQKPKPLVAQELTPLVPLRRSTAIDISIRSPPTAISQMKWSNNIMYRCRNNQECDILYNLINQARINNPTYIAMQNARGGYNHSRWGDDQGGKRSWWKLGRRSSYRASSRRPKPFSDTESSVATMTSTASALKRFASSKMFNVAKSTVTPRGSNRSSAEFSMSSGEGSGTVTPAIPVGPDGEIPSIANMKIRFFLRENASRWRDLGPAHLTIMQPPRPAGMPPPMAKDGTLIQQKRVMVKGATAGESLLDVTLGEGSFERVARTGIAVSVWDELREKDGRITHIQTTGGVNSARVRTFMLQMGSEADAAYTFSLVGRLRY